MTKICVIHGPNLNKLGEREPSVYGKHTLKAIIARMETLAQENQVELTTFQSNHEGEIIDYLHQLTEKSCDFILMNPAAYTHTSVAIRDAILAIKIPMIEVHLSNIYQREPFRHHSYFSDISVGIVSGFGPNSYYLALQAAINHLKHTKRD